jgi:hypothetical protein
MPSLFTERIVRGCASPSAARLLATVISSTLLVQIASAFWDGMVVQRVV